MQIVGKLPTIPEYFKKYINQNVDLAATPKQCCPFHKEETPSFSYSAEKQICTCFGACHRTWDLIGLHQRNYGFSTRKEAEDSLFSLYGIVRVNSLEENKVEFTANKDRIKEDETYQLALVKANTVERWLELDYVMSKNPLDLMELKRLISKWDMVGGCNDN